MIKRYTGLVALVALVLMLAACGSDDPKTQTDESPRGPVYSDAEWHWAEGWCSSNLGGLNGVELWSDERPVGFTECVQTQLPAAAEGIKRAQTSDDVDAQTPVEEYCTMIAPPAVANDYDRAWKALEQCLADEFDVIWED